MAPNIEAVLEATKAQQDDTITRVYKWNILWPDVAFAIYFHGTALYGLSLILTGRCMIATIVWNAVILLCTSLAVTAGAHRLWSHRAYSAKWQLRVLLTFFHTMASQDTIYRWVKMHRAHHKYVDTDADPHNPKRGLFFAHIGWLYLESHPDYVIKSNAFDLSDLEADPVVMFQKRWFRILIPLTCFVLPTWGPFYFWGENFWLSWHVNMFRWLANLHFTFSINSVAHKWGNRPYDANISPSENNLVAILTAGDGWHNYHHVFPWDYKSAELGTYGTNLSAAFIELMKKIGWAYNLRTASPELIKKRSKRTGDGSLFHSQEEQHQHPVNENPVWGWGDPDFPEDEKNGSSNFESSKERKLIG